MLFKNLSTYFNWSTSSLLLAGVSSNISLDMFSQCLSRMPWISSESLKNWNGSLAFESEKGGCASNFPVLTTLLLFWFILSYLGSIYLRNITKKSFFLRHCPCSQSETAQIFGFSVLNWTNQKFSALEVTDLTQTTITNLEHLPLAPQLLLSFPSPPQPFHHLCPPYHHPLWSELALI